MLPTADTPTIGVPTLGLEPLVAQLMAAGYSRDNATSALQLSNLNFSKAFDWLARNCQKQTAPVEEGPGILKMTGHFRVSLTFLFFS